MHIICGIYKITSPSKKVYIGQSINILRRLKEYKYVRCKEQIYLYRSILKHGWSAHKFEILHHCDKEELNRLEKYYVDLFNSYNSKYGMNLRDGGGSHGKMSIESKAKMARMRIGRKHSEESKKRMSESHKKIVKSKEWCDNISKGKQNISSETKKRIGEASRGRKTFLGKKHSAATKLKISISNTGRISPCRVPIIDTATGIIYSCKREAATAIGMKERTLKAMLLGQHPNKTTMQYYVHISHNLISRINSPLTAINL